MTKVAAGITTSLDGYITGPNDGRGRGLGDGGERLHYWAAEGMDVFILGGADVIRQDCARDTWGNCRSRSPRSCSVRGYVCSRASKGG